MELGGRPLAFGSWFLALGSWLLGKGPSGDERKPTLRRRSRGRLSRTGSRKAGLDVSSEASAALAAET